MNIDVQLLEEFREYRKRLAFNECPVVFMSTPTLDHIKATTNCFLKSTPLTGKFTLRDGSILDTSLRVGELIWPLFARRVDVYIDDSLPKGRVAFSHYQMIYAGTKIKKAPGSVPAKNIVPRHIP